LLMVSLRRRHICIIGINSRCSKYIKNLE
jgi:hypothetical protein